MNVSIQATSDFINYLKDECPNNEHPEIIKTRELTNEGKLQGFITMAPGDIMLSIVITYSPMIFGLLSQYVKGRKRNIVLKTDESRHNITPQNIENVINELKIELNNGTNRTF